MHFFRKHSNLSFFVCFSLFVSLTLNIFLLVERSRNGAESIEPNPNSTGWSLPRTFLSDEASSQITGGARIGKRTLVYRYDPNCGWCERNMAAFSKLAEHLISKGYTVVVCAPSGTILSPTGSLFPKSVKFVLSDREKFDQVFKLTVTPHTLILDEAGVVLTNWTGAYNGQNRKQIEAKFSISLPPLS